MLGSAITREPSCSRTDTNECLIQDKIQFTRIYSQEVQTSSTQAETQTIQMDAMNSVSGLGWTPIIFKSVLTHHVLIPGCIHMGLKEVAGLIAAPTPRQ